MMGPQVGQKRAAENRFSYFVAAVPDKSTESHVLELKLGQSVVVFITTVRTAKPHPTSTGLCGMALCAFHRLN